MCVCVYLRMHVHAYLATLCVSANDNVKRMKFNIRYVFDKKNRQNEINMKYIKFMFTSLSRQKAEKHKQIRKETWR